MSVTPFGAIDGEPVYEVTLAGRDGLQARIITWGAALRDLIVPAPGGPRRVLLGLESLDDYVRHSPSFGAVPGRYANRIGDACFTLDGREYRLTPNEGPNQLHGGPRGFNTRNWVLLGHDDRSVELGLVSPDGDAGYPGRLTATCRYELLDPAGFRITLTATSDAATPVNLTTHGYYNLDGSADVRDHLVQIFADFVTDTDGADIPTGAIVPVAGTPYDFCEARPLRGDGRYHDTDMNFVLRRFRSSAPTLAEETLAHAATVAAPTRDLALEVWTTEPGLQLYDGYKLDLAVQGHDGRRYGAYAGIALEPQRFPDAPNQAHFPPCILRPGGVSRQRSEFRFRMI